MKKVVSVWKPQGWTPLKAVKEFKNKNPDYVNEKISYAGRLDPMAEGVLLLLVGEENKKRKEYEGLQKSYESEIVLGVSTDSFDALGIIYSVTLDKMSSREQIGECLKGFIGKQDQSYPPYSSRTVDGKSLIWWTKNNRLSEIEMPKKEIEISSISLESTELIDASDLLKDVNSRIERVEGNFRQEEILKAWGEFEKKYKNEKFIKIKIKVSCSSGTYIRRLASNIGEDLGGGAFALSIIRTSVGKYFKKDCLTIWLPREDSNLEP